MCLSNLQTTIRCINNRIWSFNPCFNGCASRIQCSFNHRGHTNFVSILVLMDVPLESYILLLFSSNLYGFNPCFNGCASRIQCSFNHRGHTNFVSILVLMDVPLEFHTVHPLSWPGSLVSILVLMDVPLE